MRPLPILLAMLVLGGAAAHAEAPEEARARALQADGAALLQAGDLLRARTAFAAAQALAPTRANPYRWLGLVDAQLGRCPDARRSLDVFIEKAVPDDPRLPEVRAARDGCQARLAAPPRAEAPPALAPEAPSARLLIDIERAPAKAPRRPLHRAWWLWTAAGLVAAGVAVGVGLGVGLGPGPAMPFDPVHVR